MTRQDTACRDSSAQDTTGPAKDVHFEKIYNAVHGGDTGGSGVVAIFSDYRMAVEVVVSVGAIVLSVSALSAHKIIWGLVFLGLLGVFTPFRSGQFSGALVSTFDMLTLALFAASPIMFRKPAIGFRKPAIGFRKPGTL